MRTFAFTAIDYNNAIQRGDIKAWTKDHAMEQLERSRLSVVTLIRAKSEGGRLGSLRRGVSTMDRIVFTRNLMTMIRAGLTFTDALASAREQTDRPFLKKIIREAEQSVRAGQQFSAVLDRYAQTFPTVYRAMVKIGERSGRLVDVFEYLVKQMESDYRLLRKIRSALVYPCLIIVTMIIMVILMMAFVIPKIAAVYAESNVQMPLFTRVLITLSNFIHTHFILIGGLAVGVIVFLVVVIRAARPLRFGLHRMFLRIPGLGPIIKKVNVAVISRSVGMMLRSGLSIDDALLLASPAAAALPYQDAVAAVVPFVRRGVQVSEALANRMDLFPHIFLKMVRTGEQTGNLDEMFDHVSRYYDEDIDNWTTNVSAFIEPVLLLFTGLIVGSVAVAVLYPLWNFANII